MSGETEFDPDRFGKPFAPKLSIAGARIRASKRLGQDFTGRLRGCHRPGDVVELDHPDQIGAMPRARVTTENAYLSGCRQVYSGPLRGLFGNPLKEELPTPEEEYLCCPCDFDRGPNCHCTMCISSQYQPHPTPIMIDGTDARWLNACEVTETRDAQGWLLNRVGGADHPICCFYQGDAQAAKISFENNEGYFYSQVWKRKNPGDDHAMWAKFVPGGEYLIEDEIPCPDGKELIAVDPFPFVETRNKVIETIGIDEVAAWQTGFDHWGRQVDLGANWAFVRPGQNWEDFFVEAVPPRWAGEFEEDYGCDRCGNEVTGDRMYAMPKQIQLVLNLTDKECEPDEHHGNCADQGERAGAPPRNFSAANATYILDKVTTEGIADQSYLCLYSVEIPGRCPANVNETTDDDYCVIPDEREFGVSEIQVAYRTNPNRTAADPALINESEGVGNYWRGLPYVDPEPDQEAGSYYRFNPAISVMIGFRNGFDCQYCGLTHRRLAPHDKEVFSSYCPSHGGLPNCQKFLPIRGWVTGMDGGKAGSCYWSDDGEAYDPYDNCWTSVNINWIRRYCDQPPEQGEARPNFIDMTNDCLEYERIQNWWGGWTDGECIKRGIANCEAEDVQISSTNIGTASITEIPDE